MSITLIKHLIGCIFKLQNTNILFRYWVITRLVVCGLFSQAQSQISILFSCSSNVISAVKWHSPYSGNISSNGLEFFGSTLLSLSTSSLISFDNSPYSVNLSNLFFLHEVQLTINGIECLVGLDINFSRAIGSLVTHWQQKMLSLRLENFLCTINVNTSTVLPPLTPNTFEKINSSRFIILNTKFT